MVVHAVTTTTQEAVSTGIGVSVKHTAGSVWEAASLILVPGDKTGMESAKGRLGDTGTLQCQKHTPEV